MRAQLIGVLGGGQLGRMLALAGYPLGLHFRFLDPAPDAPVRCLAEHIVGTYDDVQALARFAGGLDSVTYEFENVPVAVAERLAAELPVYPPPRALAIAQDRLVEKTFFSELGIATAPFVPVDDRAALDAAVRRIGLPAVLKTRRLGYDGKGQAVLRATGDVDAAWLALGGKPLILESYVPFRRELSILAVRGRSGEIVVYPLVENHHREGILRLSIAPAPDAACLQTQAEAIATTALNALAYVGVLAIELFEHDGRLLVNEMAPRVHNSGHWTIEGTQTSQFANHVRAAAGWPLGSPAPRGLAAMINLIGAIPDPAAILKEPGAHLHLYDKAPRPGRKVGHVTLVADDAATLAERVERMLMLVGERDTLAQSGLPLARK